MTAKMAPKEPRKIDLIRNVINGKSDNLFICWGSPEERCKGSILKLDTDYKAEHAFLLTYQGHDSEKRQKNINEMTDKLKKVAKLDVFVLDETEPLSMLKEVCEKIESVVKHEKIPRITIDITTPIKWHLLVFLKFLGSRGLLNKARFLYTEPEDYIIDLFQSLSFGIKEIFPIPTFYGNYDFSKDDLLVLMLGYEGSRAMALHEDVDPAECLLLIADPPYQPEWKGRTEELNKEIINLVGSSKVRYIDSRNPVKVSQQLHDILLKKEFAKYNHVISPIGTKPQALGLYLYLRSSSIINTILVYGAPLRHNELFYSSGIGRTWELPS